MQDFLKSTIKEAGYIAKKYFHQGVTHRIKTTLGDLVTDADIAVSNFIIEKIQERYPEHGIHTEEEGDDINPGAEYEWVIDPIDGTRNFAMGISFWCVMIAILKDSELYMSAIYNPLADELFFAVDGEGAYMNDQRIYVNKVDTLDYGFGVAIRTTDTDKEEEFKQVLSKLNLETSAWLHGFGTMLVACHLANGGIDFFVNNCGFDHDYLAPALICLEAGAVVTDSDGNKWTRYRRDIIIANPNLHPKLLALFK
ncbi:MAG: inositol monophosphatase [bacterium]|nr:inositol monophosphatase [bacterium]